MNLVAPSGASVAALRKALGLSRAQLSAIIMLDEALLAEFELSEGSASLSPRLSDPALSMLLFAIRKLEYLAPFALKQWGNRMKFFMQREGRVLAMRAFLDGP